jgi:hypothetical protein
MGEAKRPYEPPRVMRLDNGSSASGADQVCTVPGSGATTFCQAGYGAEGYCASNGTTPYGQCSNTGDGDSMG